MELVFEILRPAFGRKKGGNYMQFVTTPEWTDSVVIFVKRAKQVSVLPERAECCVHFDRSSSSSSLLHGTYTFAPVWQCSCIAVARGKEARSSDSQYINLLSPQRYTNPTWIHKGSYWKILLQAFFHTRYNNVLSHVVRFSLVLISSFAIAFITFFFSNYVHTLDITKLGLL